VALWNKRGELHSQDNQLFSLHFQQWELQIEKELILESPLNIDRFSHLIETQRGFNMCGAKITWYHIEPKM
jgi:hypothetical protein